MGEFIHLAIRIVLSLCFLFVATKLLTKRSLSSLTYFDYVAGATLGTIAGNLAFNIKIKTSIFIFAIILTTLIIMVISHLSLKSPVLRKILAGKPTIVIQNGKILEQNMSKMNYTFDYLNQQLRREQVFDISLVEFAILEPNGELSIKLKSQNRPLTPRDLAISTEYEGLATEIVLDGKVIEDNMYRINLNREWLNEQIKTRGINNVQEIAFAALATDGKLYIDLYQDELVQ